MIRDTLRVGVVLEHAVDGAAVETEGFVELGGDARATPLCVPEDLVARLRPAPAPRAPRDRDRVPERAAHRIESPRGHRHPGLMRRALRAAHGDLARALVVVERRGR